MKNLLIIFVLLIIVSCANPTGSQTNTKDSTNAVSDQVAATSQQVQSAKFEFDTKDDANGNPQSTINIIINGKKTKVDQEVGPYSPLEKKDYKDKQIPDHALCACSVFWAGSGSHYYAIQEGSKIKIMKCYWGEGNDNTTFTYQEIKTLDAL